MSTRYHVFIAPRNGLRTYDPEIDVSDYIEFTGIGKISKSIDATDYNVGIFVSSDLTLKGRNYNGYFNDETDNRSIFKFSRDLAKVRVVFSNSAGDTIQFRGLINEAATKINTQDGSISITVLSLDSVLRTTNIPAGIISDGMTCKHAMEAILTQPAITAALSVTPININPTYNFTIDAGAPLDNLSVQDGMNQLLIASNSVMTIDDSENLFIRNRVMSESVAVLNLFGPYDIYGRQNTVALTEYNTGKQRMFNSFTVNTEIKENAAFSQQYGYNPKKLTFDFITNVDTAATIAQTLLDEFEFPKLECQVDIPAAVAPDIQLLDAISLNWPLLIKPIAGHFFPVVGITKIGDASMPLPIRYGNLEISPNVAWKPIQITDDPQKFIKTLKLRQAGTTISDGYFTIPGSSKIGFAIIGESKIGGTGTTSYNPSIIGAAQVGNTMVS